MAPDIVVEMVVVEAQAVPGGQKVMIQPFALVIYRHAKSGIVVEQARLMACPVPVTRVAQVEQVVPAHIATQSMVLVVVLGRPVETEVRVVRHFPQ